jgi:hypothetical protein
MKPKNIDVLKGLLSEAKWLHLLKGKPYDALVDYLIQIAPQWQDENSDFGTPTIKKISEDLNEKKVHKWLPELVGDLINLNNEKPDLFKTTDEASLYCLHASEKQTATFIYYYIWTDRHFHVGERFDWFFSKVRMPHSFYYIREIGHEYLNGNVNTTIYLESGFQNQYRDLLLDRANFEGKISLSQYFKLFDFQVDDLLRKLYK